MNITRCARNSSFCMQRDPCILGRTSTLRKKKTGYLDPPPFQICVLSLFGLSKLFHLFYEYCYHRHIVVFQYQAISMQQIQSNNVFNAESNTTVLNAELFPQLIADLSIFISLKGICFIFGCFCRRISEVKVRTWVNVSDGAGTCLVCTVAVNDTASAVIYAFTITHQLTWTD